MKKHSLSSVSLYAAAAAGICTILPSCIMEASAQDIYIENDGSCALEKDEGATLLLRGKSGNLYRLNKQSKNVCLIEMSNPMSLFSSNLQIKYEGIWYPVTEIGHKQNGTWTSVIKSGNDFSDYSLILGCQNQDIPAYTSAEGVTYITENAPHQESFSLLIHENALVGFQGTLIVNPSKTGTITWQDGSSQSGVGSSFRNIILAWTKDDVPAADRKYVITAPEIVRAPNQVKVGEDVQIVLKKGTYTQNTIAYGSKRSLGYAVGAPYQFRFLKETKEGGVFELKGPAQDGSNQAVHCFLEPGFYDMKLYNGGIGDTFTIEAISQTSTAPNSSVKPTSAGWKQENGHWYYLMAEGKKATGWKQISNTWYLFGEDGIMKTGWVNDGNNWYHLGTNGAMKTGWQQISYDGQPQWFWFAPSGKMHTGWKELPANGKSQWYFFNADGTMKANSTMGKYSFDASGVCVNPY